LHPLFNLQIPLKSASSVSLKGIFAKKGGHETKKKAKTSNQQALQGSPFLARL
jgi:hypothetical protein